LTKQRYNFFVRNKRTGLNVATLLTQREIKRQTLVFISEISLLKALNMRYVIEVNKTGIKMLVKIAEHMYY